MDQVVNADAEEELASDEEDEIFFQDIDLLQNHGIVRNFLSNFFKYFFDAGYLFRTVWRN